MKREAREVALSVIRGHWMVPGNLTEPATCGGKDCNWTCLSLSRRHAFEEHLADEIAEALNDSEGVTA